MNNFDICDIPLSKWDRKTVLWEIKGISHLIGDVKKKGDASKIEFSAGKHVDNKSIWQLTADVNKRRTHLKIKVSMREYFSEDDILNHNKREGPLMIKLKVGGVNADGKIVKEFDMDDGRVTYMDDKTMGFDFISLAELAKPTLKLVSNDKLKLRVDIWLHTNLATPFDEPPLEDPELPAPAPVMQNWDGGNFLLKHLWATSNFSDVTLKFGCCRNFRLHKAVLGSTCGYFRNLFASQSTGNEVNLTDIVDPSALEAFLSWVYMGNMGPHWSWAPETCAYLLHIAEKFQLKDFEGLKHHIFGTLCKQVDDRLRNKVEVNDGNGNALQRKVSITVTVDSATFVGRILRLAYSYKADQKYVDFLHKKISENTDKFKSFPSFCNMVKSSPEAFGNSLQSTKMKSMQQVQQPNVRKEIPSILSPRPSAQQKNEVRNEMPSTLSPRSSTQQKNEVRKEMPSVFSTNPPVQEKQDARYEKPVDENESVMKYIM